jgi:hypothetical protein
VLTEDKEAAYHCTANRLNTMWIQGDGLDRFLARWQYGIPDRW